MVSPIYHSAQVLPLDSPVHGSVRSEEWRDNVEDLVTEATEGVEDRGVEGTGEGALAVGREGVSRNALGGRTACIVAISDCSNSTFNVP